MRIDAEALFIDADADTCAIAKSMFAFLHRPRLHVCHAFVDRDNIDELLVEYGFEGEIDLLSIDIDGNDY